ncbi:MAG: hypothetical protein IT385_10500 [Deltaproteobacteria bacterium]|nr:hypothetical protein [Deltaproteobacteria bacterium]
MKNALQRFYLFLDRPLFGWSRIVLVVLAIPLAFSLTEPLWRISMQAPQYPKGLYLEIYTHKIDGGNEGHDIQEINTLNHYIGMRPLERADMDELDWMPFSIVLIILLTLRTAAIGNIRMLVDLAVFTFLVGSYGMARFIYKLHVYGHDLDPKAPLHIEPFSPAVFGTKQIANFSTSSYPQMGTILITIFITGVAGLTLWHLIKGRIDAVKADRQAAAAAAPTDAPS